MPKKKGEKYKCESCGLVLLVEDECGCDEPNLICCNVPMKSVPVAKAKPKPKTKAVKTKK